MCPHCRAFITTSDSICPYCNERVGPKAASQRDPGEVIAGWIPHARFVTTMLLIINAGLFLATSMLPGGADNPNALYALGAMQAQSIWHDHQWWRLVTAGFLHGGIVHIFMNGWVLLDLGAQIEVVFGQARLIAFYVLTSVCGYVFSMAWSLFSAEPGMLSPVSVGASAALFGFIGAMIALGVANPSSMGRMIRTLYTKWAIYGLAYGFLPVVLGFVGIHLPIALDNAAHIGGLACGFGVGYVAGIPAHSTHLRERFWQIMAGACILLTLVSFFLVYLHFPRQTQ
jgi:rhomboid protease GluP